MAITYIPNSKKYLCLSTDTKPDLVVGDEMFESDTGITYAFDGTDWAVLIAPGPEKTEATHRKVTTSDWDVEELLLKILTELKKIEYHLSIATDTNL